MNAEASVLYDVIVVGAGPTGLTLANLLGVEGLSTLVVERNASTVQEPRAVSIDDESLRTMQAAGMIDTVMMHVVPGYGSRYLSPNGVCFLTVKPTGTPYGHPRRNAFRQPILEAQLRVGLDRFGNVETRFGWAMESFEDTGEEVSAVLGGDGERHIVRGRFLVGCDGAWSPVREALGFTLAGETLPERWLIVDLEDSPAEQDTMVFCDVERPCIALPGPNDTRRFEFKLFPGETDEQMTEPSLVEGLIRSRGVAAGSRIVRKTVYKFHARVANHWRKGRVFLAGDAAHLTPPFAGQGMNSGIRDAHNLAWKLAAVVRGELATPLLDTYEEERAPHVWGMIELALTMGRIMGPRSRMRGWLTQTGLRTAGLWPPLKAWFGEMRYKPRPYFKKGFVTPSAHPFAGRLLPQPKVRGRTGRDALLDDVLPHGFVLVGLGVTAPQLDSVARRLDTATVPIATFALSTGDDADWMIGDAAGALAPAWGTVLIVRPDRYVMAGFRPDDDAAIAAVSATFAHFRGSRQKSQPLQEREKETL